MEADYKVPIYTDGKFEVCIPLSMLLGFAEDYKKIIIGARQELVIVLATSHLDAVLGTGNTPNVGAVTLSSIEWFMPHVTPSTRERVRLLNVVKKEKLIDMAFRSWTLVTCPSLAANTRNHWVVQTSSNTEKPRHVILALQTGRQHSLTADKSMFDHCKIENVKIFLNSESYPYVDLNASFDTEGFMLPYYLYSQFQSSYYGREPCPVLSPAQYRNMAPLIVIDTSKQNEHFQNSTVDCRIEITCKENVPANTAAYCLILHDRVVQYDCFSGLVKMV